VTAASAIGRDAFEVGEDVRDAFCDEQPDDASHFRPHGARKWLADLRALAVARLVRAGVESIASIDACTFSDATRFYSWRRDRAAGRFAALAWRAPVADGV
jgi:copper oxidase (laccase) domain-containing protein